MFSKGFGVNKQQSLAFHSCSVCEAEASWPPPFVRGRRPRRKSGRWLPRHCHRGSASAPLPSSVRSEGLQRSRTRADRRLSQNTVQRLVGNLNMEVVCIHDRAHILCGNQIFVCSLGSCSLVFLFPRFPARALPCGACATALPWQTGHSHGQDLARLWRDKQDHDGEFPCWLHARSWLWLLCKVLKMKFEGLGWHWLLHRHCIWNYILVLVMLLQSRRMQEHNLAVWGARGDGQPGGQSAGHDGPHSLWAFRWHPFTGIFTDS